VFYDRILQQDGSSSLVLASAEKHPEVNLAASAHLISDSVKSLHRLCLRVIFRFFFHNFHLSRPS
jgi:hypothetical protein